MKDMERSWNQEMEHDKKIKYELVNLWTSKIRSQCCHPYILYCLVKQNKYIVGVDLFFNFNVTQ